MFQGFERLHPEMSSVKQRVSAPSSSLQKELVRLLIPKCTYELTSQPDYGRILLSSSSESGRLRSYSSRCHGLLTMLAAAAAARGFLTIEESIQSLHLLDPATLAPPGVSPPASVLTSLNLDVLVLTEATSASAGARSQRLFFLVAVGGASPEAVAFEDGMSHLLAILFEPCSSSFYFLI